MAGYSAVVLAGGAARRMGGVDKPGLPVGGRSMRDRVLDAVADADVRVLVGPPRPTPEGVRTIREQPPGGGPVAAVAAGLALLPPGTTVVAVLAGDLPLLTGRAIGVLRDRLRASDPPVPPAPFVDARPAPAVGQLPPASAAAPMPSPALVDGVCFVDGQGRRQSLCGVWRVSALRAAVDRLAAARGGSVAGASLRTLLAGLAVAEIHWSGDGPPPWFDCDTDEDVRRAEEWAR